MVDKSTIEKLIENTPLAVIVLGIVVFIFGAAGGLPILTPLFQVTDPAWKIALGIMGAILVLGGLALVPRFGKPPSKSPTNHEDLDSLSDATKNAIKQVYQTVLERLPDTNGLEIYGKQLQTGQRNVRMIVRELGKSKEYYEKFIISTPPRTAVGLLYRHFLCRDPENEDIILEHIHRLNTEGYKSIVDKLTISPEYNRRFGDHSPPCTD